MENTDDAYIKLIQANCSNLTFMEMSDLIYETADHLPDNIYLNMYNKLKCCKDLNTYQCIEYAKILREFNEANVKTNAENTKILRELNEASVDYENSYIHKSKQLDLYQDRVFFMDNIIKNYKSINKNNEKQFVLMNNIIKELKSGIKKYNEQEVAMYKTNYNLKEAIKQKDQALLRERDRSNQVIGYVYKFMKQEKDLDDFDEKLQNIYFNSSNYYLTTSEDINEACGSTERLSFIGHNLILEFLVSVASCRY